MKTSNQLNLVLFLKKCLIIWNFSTFSNFQLPVVTSKCHKIPLYFWLWSLSTISSALKFCCLCISLQPQSERPCILEEKQRLKKCFYSIIIIFICWKLGSLGPMKSEDFRKYMFVKILIRHTNISGSVNTIWKNFLFIDLSSCSLNFLMLKNNFYMRRIN